MGTQNEPNGAEPQNEFLSGFKIKDRAASLDDENQHPSVNQAEIKDGGAVFNKTSLEQRDHTDSNPYRLTQQINKNSPLEQVDNNLFEQKSGFSFVQKLKGRFFQGQSESADTRQKVMVVLIPILFVVMVFMFRQVLVKPPQKTKGAEPKDKSARSVNKSSGDEIEWAIPDPLPVTIINPTTSGQNTADNTGQENSSSDNEKNAIYVHGIVYSSDNPSAYIGNSIVHVNQEVNGVVVVEINEDNVVFERNGQRLTLKVGEGILLKKMDQDN